MAIKDSLLRSRHLREWTPLSAKHLSFLDASTSWRMDASILQQFSRSMSRCFKQFGPPSSPSSPTLGSFKSKAGESFGCIPGPAQAAPTPHPPSILRERGHSGNSWRWNTEAMAAMSSHWYMGSCPDNKPNSCSHSSHSQQHKGARIAHTAASSSSSGLLSWPLTEDINAGTQSITCQPYEWVEKEPSPATKELPILAWLAMRSCRNA